MEAAGPINDWQFLQGDELKKSREKAELEQPEQSGSTLDALVIGPVRTRSGWLRHRLQSIFGKR